jgi:hypothetical protein
MVFFDKITIYSILGLLLDTSCDIFGKNENYKVKKKTDAHLCLCPPTEGGEVRELLIFTPKKSWGKNLSG